MNQYGLKAKQHWQKLLPGRVRALTDPDSFFSELGEQIAERVEELSQALAGEDSPSEAYMDKLGRLQMARFNAEAQALREMALLEPEQS